MQQPPLLQNVSHWQILLTSGLWPVCGVLCVPSNEYTRCLYSASWSLLVGQSKGRKQSSPKQTGTDRCTRTDFEGNYDIVAQCNPTITSDATTGRCRSSLGRAEQCFPPMREEVSSYIPSSMQNEGGLKPLQFVADLVCFTVCTSPQPLHFRTGR